MLTSRISQNAFTDQHGPQIPNRKFLYEITTNAADNWVHENIKSSSLPLLWISTFIPHSSWILKITQFFFHKRLSKFHTWDLAFWADPDSNMMMMCLRSLSNPFPSHLLSNGRRPLCDDTLWKYLESFPKAFNISKGQKHDSVWMCWEIWLLGHVIQCYCALTCDSCVKSLIMKYTAFHKL